MTGLPALLLGAALVVQAVEVRRIAAPDAEQGVASDGRHVYAISNHAITRVRLLDGRPVAHWNGDPAQFPHLNSCIVRRAKLICAASNYPAVPMSSRIETFNRWTLRQLATRLLEPGHGSLTWVLRHDGAWWAGFANYDGKGGEPGRDHTATAFVRYDDAWRETASWRFPADVLDRFAPRSASGGSWGNDGLLYVTGHDRPEAYALAVPPGGGTLRLVATVALPTGGQAIGWDPKAKRLLWSIERKTREVVASRVPQIVQ